MSEWQLFNNHLVLFAWNFRLMLSTAMDQSFVVCMYPAWIAAIVSKDVRWLKVEYRTGVSSYLRLVSWIYLHSKVVLHSGTQSEHCLLQRPSRYSHSYCVLIATCLIIMDWAHFQVISNFTISKQIYIGLTWLQLNYSFRIYHQYMPLNSCCYW